MAINIGLGLPLMLFSTALCLASSLGSVWAQVDHRMTNEEALRLGEAFGVVVGEVDEEIRRILGLQRAEGVVVFEVIGDRPADLAGIKPRSIIKEIDKIEIKTLRDFGRALKAATQTANFTIATFEPADPNNQGVGGGINFYFVRIPKN